MFPSVFITTMFLAADGSATTAETTPVDLGWRSEQRCGPNSLYVLLFMHGKAPDYNDLLSSFHLTSQGASAADLARVAGELGIPLTPVRADPQALTGLPLPAIVHYRQPGSITGHYVVLLSVNRDGTYTVLECTRGRMERVSRGEFLDRWSGVTLVRSDQRKKSPLDTMLLVTSGLVVLGIPAAIWSSRNRRRNVAA